MKKINNFFKTFFLIFFILTTQVESKILRIGNSEAKVTVKVFSSLTCPHCANFHEVIFVKLKDEYIEKGLVKFEHHPFPLDLAALNAEIILSCKNNNLSSQEKIFEFLTELYNKQSTWAVGSDINKINEFLKKIGLNFQLNNKEMDACLKNEVKQDEILEQRIQAQ